MSEERKAAERLVVKGIGAVLLIAFAFWAVPVFWDKLSPFIIAVPIASLLQPVIRFAQEKLKIKRGISVLICVLLILERYLWLRRDRSIYIMNRIPAAETFRRCALLLLIYAAAVLVLTLIVIVLLKARYMAVVPEEIMPPDEPIRPFDALLFKGRFNFEPWDFNV